MSTVALAIVLALFKLAAPQTLAQDEASPAPAPPFSASKAPDAEDALNPSPDAPPTPDPSLRATLALVATPEELLAAWASDVTSGRPSHLVLTQHLDMTLLEDEQSQRIGMSAEMRYSHSSYSLQGNCSTPPPGDWGARVAADWLPGQCALRYRPSQHASIFNIRGAVEPLLLWFSSLVAIAVDTVRIEVDRPAEAAVEEAPTTSLPGVWLWTTDMTWHAPLPQANWSNQRRRSVEKWYMGDCRLVGDSVPRSSPALSSLPSFSAVRVTASGFHPSKGSPGVFALYNRFGSARTLISSFTVEDCALPALALQDYPPGVDETTGWASPTDTSVHALLYTDLGAVEESSNASSLFLNAVQGLPDDAPNGWFLSTEDASFAALRREYEILLISEGLMEGSAAARNEGLPDGSSCCTTTHPTWLVVSVALAATAVVTLSAVLLLVIDLCGVRRRGCKSCTSGTTQSKGSGSDVASDAFSFAANDHSIISSATRSHAELLGGHSGHSGAPLPSGAGVKEARGARSSSWVHCKRADPAVWSNNVYAQLDKHSFSEYNGTDNFPPLKFTPPRSSLVMQWPLRLPGGLVPSSSEAPRCTSLKSISAQPLPSSPPLSHASSSIIPPLRFPHHRGQQPWQPPLILERPLHPTPTSDSTSATNPCVGTGSTSDSASNHHRHSFQPLSPSPDLQSHSDLRTTLARSPSDNSPLHLFSSHDNLLFCAMPSGSISTGSYTSTRQQTSRPSHDTTSTTIPFSPTSAFNLFHRASPSSPHPSSPIPSSPTLCHRQAPIHLHVPTSDTPAVTPNSLTARVSCMSDTSSQAISPYAGSGASPPSAPGPGVQRLRSVSNGGTVGPRVRPCPGHLLSRTEKAVRDVFLASEWRKSVEMQQECRRASSGEQC